ncbi:DUF3558 domain-containing protein [Nocardia fusca]|uniref:DUF3558 domain-containing protein n=1 Tax=Nocardia fusca TaxID=941183 RepID=UPI0037C7C370
MPRYLLPVVAAGLLAAGCTAETNGTPAPVTTAAVPILNPCDEADLPASALKAAGLDPATKNVITDAPTGETSWRVCSWDPVDELATYRVELYSTSHTMDETRNRTDLSEFTDADIGGREGVTFIEKSDTDRSRCRAAFAAEQGSFILSTAWLEVDEKPADLCALAVQYLSDLEPALPK